MKAYHFLRADMTAGNGTEPPWRVGETRKWKGEIEMCKSGYHSSPTWLDALDYAPGPMACIVAVSRPIAWDIDRLASRTRTLVACANVERELRIFACDCAERALQREQRRRQELDACSWEAVGVARAFADGKASKEDLVIARDAAGAAAAEAAVGGAAAAGAIAAAGDVAAGAAVGAAAAAGDVAWDAGVAWQTKHLAKLLNKAIKERGNENTS